MRSSWSPSVRLLRTPQSWPPQCCRVRSKGTGYRPCAGRRHVPRTRRVSSLRASRIVHGSERLPARRGPVSAPGRFVSYRRGGPHGLHRTRRGSLVSLHWTARSVAGRRMAMSDVHVVPSGDKWALEVDGQQRDTFPTQNEAVTRGRTLLLGRDGRAGLGTATRLAHRQGRVPVRAVCVSGLTRRTSRRPWHRRRVLRLPRREPPCGFAGRCRRQCRAGIGARLERRRLRRDQPDLHRNPSRRRRP